ncbi:MAG TPA: hypothetical protein VK054_13790 [Beutenbergiaceae bacterium]|nr:hypothetical protein [Beutenbergiaceae bacterium]
MSETPIFDAVHADREAFKDTVRADLDALEYIQLRPRKSVLRTAWDAFKLWWVQW